ncbi:UNVERIFIED_CONTAM: hypothetical protein FKN15_069907 [Acipenser sinensis]
MTTDSAAPDLSTAPNPTIVGPAAQNGQCAPTDQHPPKRGTQADPFSIDRDQEMKISESVQFSDEVENRGLLESSTRLKPHEAQSYRKKALWVSWASILVTIALAVAAFSLLESSTRLKPHEAQSYRKKALWVSWASILVTIALAVAAFNLFNWDLERSGKIPERSMARCTKAWLSE